MAFWDHRPAAGNIFFSCTASDEWMGFLKNPTWIENARHPKQNLATEGHNQEGIYKGPGSRFGFIRAWLLHGCYFVTFYLNTILTAPTLHHCFYFRFYLYHRKIQDFELISSPLEWMSEISCHNIVLVFFTLTHTSVLSAPYLHPFLSLSFSLPL